MCTTPRGRRHKHSLAWHHRGLLVCIILSVACNFERDQLQAEQAVDAFWRQAELQQFEDLYRNADAELRSTTSEADFTALLREVQSALGKRQRSTIRNVQRGWFVQRRSVVAIDVETTFETGIASERFLWRVRSDRLLLLGYYINSEKLQPENGRAKSTQASPQ